MTSGRDVASRDRPSLDGGYLGTRGVGFSGGPKTKPQNMYTWLQNRCANVTLPVLCRWEVTVAHLKKSLGIVYVLDPDPKTLKPEMESEPRVP